MLVLANYMLALVFNSARFAPLTSFATLAYALVFSGSLCFSLLSYFAALALRFASLTSLACCLIAVCFALLGLLSALL